VVRPKVNPQRGIQVNATSGKVSGGSVSHFVFLPLGTLS